jgi:hypothetical protein
LDLFQSPATWKRKQTTNKDSVSGLGVEFSGKALVQHVQALGLILAPQKKKFSSS